MSFGEIAILLIIGVVVVGPRKLPTLMRTTGQWISKLRRMSTDLRSQSGIDDLIRSEGLEKEIHELRALSRVNIVDTLVAPVMAPAPPKPAAQLPAAPAKPRPFVPTGPPREKEFPLIGCDSYGALPDDAAPYVEEPRPAAAGDAIAAEPGAAVPATPATATVPVAPGVVTAVGEVEATIEVISVTSVIAAATAGASADAGADPAVDAAFADDAVPTRHLGGARKLSFPLADSAPPLAKTLASRTEEPSVDVEFAPPSFLSPSERAAEQADPFSSDEGASASDKNAAISDKNAATSDKNAAEPAPPSAQRAAS